MSKLYIVATPIGNLDDITYRAVKVLKQVDLIICEDTRHSKKLLFHLGISKPLESMFAASEKKKSSTLASKIASGTEAAFISDAGTPGVQDPGTLLVWECRRAGVEVIPIPGASAITTALSVSGFTGSGFIYEGFLPVKSGAKKKIIESWSELKDKCVVFYESTHRILKTLELISEVYRGQIQLFVGREMTKRFEEYISGTPDEISAHLNRHSVKGEFVVLAQKIRKK